MLIQAGVVVALKGFAHHMEVAVFDLLQHLLDLAHVEGSAGGHAGHAAGGHAAGRTAEAAETGRKIARACRFTWKGEEGVSGGGFFVTLNLKKSKEKATGLVRDNGNRARCVRGVFDRDATGKETRAGVDAPAILFG